MVRKRYTEEQIIAVLRGGEAIYRDDFIRGRSTKTGVWRISRELYFGYCLLHKPSEC
jgi:hypothetical protein